MNLSRSTRRYLSDVFDNLITHSYFEEICDKIEVDVELSAGGSKRERLFNLMSELNGSDKLIQLIQILFIEYGGRRHIKSINNILRRDGYSIDENGFIISYMGEQVQLTKTQSKIVDDLNSLGFSRVVELYNSGIEEYGRGKEFPSLRVAIEGLIEEILKKESLSVTVNIRNDMKKLFEVDVLNNDPDPFKIHGQSEELELVHSYGIYSLLSHYLNHYGEISEEEKHFIFFQSIGLIWLITQRYLKYLKNKGIVK